MATEPKRAWGYVRVSTGEQYESRLSIDEQRRQIEQVSQREGAEITEGRMCEESASAYSLEFINRPVGKVLNLKMQDGDVIYIAKVDRAFRNMVDALTTVKMWRSRGITCRMLDLPGNGDPLFDDLILAVMAWAAQFESKRKSERILEANRAARRAGRQMGPSYGPWGFRWMGKSGKAKLVYQPQHREIMSLVYDLYVHNQMGIRQICSWLICNRVPVVDRRPEWLANVRRKAQDYAMSRIPEMVTQEAEYRYYETLGLSPEEAAWRWWEDYKLDKVPDTEEIESRLATHNQFRPILQQQKEQPNASV